MIADHIRDDEASPRGVRVARECWPVSGCWQPHAHPEHPVFFHPRARDPAAM